MTPRDELSALDWIGALLGLFAGGFAIAFPYTLGPSFAAMFRDFGAPLPAPTALILSGWFAPMLGFVPFLLLAAVVLGKPIVTVRTRRYLIVVAFFMGLLASVFCLFAVYLPIFELAGKIH